jgi:hypothetical protein
MTKIPGMHTGNAEERKRTSFLARSFRFLSRCARLASPSLIACSSASWCFLQVRVQVKGRAKGKLVTQRAKARRSEQRYFLRGRVQVKVHVVVVVVVVVYAWAHRCVSLRNCFSSNSLCSCCRCNCS